MGTNFYLHENICPVCHREQGTPLHIGKSSMGWCFALHVGEMESAIHGTILIESLEDWRELWEQSNTEIRDEYGDTLTSAELLERITERSGKERDENEAPFGYSSWQDFDESNYSEPGPNGLLRHRIDGNHCVGHGEGTWDYIQGEFS